MSRPLVVVGDALLDVDLVGTASRLTPDAPVPVVEDVETRERPGGAALAAVLAAASRDVVLVAPMADDEGAERLRALLHRAPRDFGHPTSVWTLELAAEVAYAEGLTAQRVSDETVRATLARLGIRWRRAKTWITSPDPAYAQKNSGATA